MRLSLNVTNYSWPGADALADELDDVARAADAGGLDTLWINDHLLQAEPDTGRIAAGGHANRDGQLIQGRLDAGHGL